jgi:hypothetical protein
VDLVRFFSSFILYTDGRSAHRRAATYTQNNTEQQKSISSNFLGCWLTKSKASARNSPSHPSPVSDLRFWGCNAALLAETLRFHLQDGRERITTLPSASAAFFLGFLFHPEEGGGTFLRNFELTPNYTPRYEPESCSLLSPLI